MVGIPVMYLEDIAEKLEDTSDFWTHYLDLTSGEVVELFDESNLEYAEDIEKNKELETKIKDSDVYIRLPNKYEIYEYKIMGDFAETILDPYKREKLFRALNGKKPFRHFKDTLFFNDLDQVYYKFRFQALIEIAREWCDYNEIPYKTRDNQENL